MTKWFVLIGVILFICIAEWIREIITFKVTHYEIKSKKLNELSHERTVVFLSDLHNNHYGKNNERLLAAVKEQNPDLILIGGDMLVGKGRVSVKVAEELAHELTKICPVYYAYGNHEQRIIIHPEKYGMDFEEYKEKLARYGVIFLENEHVDLQWDAVPVQIHGIDIPEQFYKKFCKASLSVEDVIKCIGQADATKYQILLAHNPLYVEAYLKWGADLVLSGHLHGGVVRIPGLGGIITPQFGMFPRYSGELTVKDGKSVVVSKGLGTHTIKLRFLNPAELVVLHIEGNES